ncbi:MAG: ABC transporter permease [Verrucomicrobia bacterium]|nr:ABC transporter permease [Verrucomicrobiota bacterium]
MPAELSSPEVAPPEREAAESATSLWRDAWHRLAKNKIATAGLWFVIVLTLICFLVPLLEKLPAGVRPVGLSFSYEQQTLEDRAMPPNAKHWLGTDQLGRDVLSRLLYGGRISLTVGLSATAVSLTIGLLWGALAGYFGGKLDAVMMRIVDILYALPLAVFVILLMVFVGRSIFLLFFAIGAVEWLTMARIVRGQVMSLKKQEFIEAAIALGLRKRRIILRHIIPNVLGPVIVYATLTVPGVMLLEAFLSFLGLGVQPPMSSWGSLIKEGADWMEDSPWILISTGAVFSMTLFSLNFLGDGLRDALDVRASKD